MNDTYEDDFLSIDTVIEENKQLTEKIGVLEKKLLESEWMLKQERVRGRRAPKEEEKKEAIGNSNESGTKWAFQNEIGYQQIEFLNQIASGGNSVVFKGKWMGCEVTVKRMFDPIITEENRDEFRNEIRIHCLLRHPNIVCFFGAVTSPPYLCIVMEFMSKGSLYSLLHLKGRAKREKKMDLSMQVGILKDLIAALSYMHSLGILHNDIKSANVINSVFLRFI